MSPPVPTDGGDNHISWVEQGLKGLVLFVWLFQSSLDLIGFALFAHPLSVWKISLQSPRSQYLWHLHCAHMT